MSGYDVAQICKNGHVINDTAKCCPQHNKKFCDKCGSPTIDKCPSCNTDIQGYYYYDDIPRTSTYTVPLFCHNCGKPYPWTKTRMQVAKEYIQELELATDEKNELALSIDEIVKDTPKTAVSATKFKRLATKAGQGTLGILKDILVDIMSEAAKKIIYPS